jgi:4-aminobutyrate aminotransferase
MKIENKKVFGELIAIGNRSLDVYNRRLTAFPPCLAKRKRSRTLVGGKGIYRNDLEGNWYIDWTAQEHNVGHRHPKVVDAIKKQSDEEANPIIDLELAEKIKEISPGSLSDGKVFWSKGGADATEFTMKLTRYCSKKTVFIACQGSFHGGTLGALSLTFADSKLRGYSHPLLSDVVHVPYPYCYRCSFGQSYPDCGLECIDYLRYVLDTVAYPGATAAFFIEPIQSHGGGVSAPPEYLKELRKICNDNEIFLVDDEVVCGFGRTGKMFGIQHSAIEPDIMIMGKPLASGLPMGAGIGQREIMEKWDEAWPRSSGVGHEICCAASLATIDAIQKEKLLENSSKIGDYMLKRFREMYNEHKLIGDVRGKGLWLGIEFVKDRNKKTPATKETREIVNNAFKKGLLLLIGGTYGQSLRIVPPLIMTEEQAEIGLNIFDEVLKSID